MELGKIDRWHPRLAHSFTEKLLKLAKEYPNYPIAVLIGEEGNSGDYTWVYATQVDVMIEEILDCDTDWWKSKHVCADREEFEEEARRLIWDKLQEELGRTPTEEEEEMAWKAVREAHEPYWKKCITIMADN